MSRSARRKSQAILTQVKALRRLSDKELLSGLQDLHGDERTALLKILLGLAEIEHRQLYLPNGYSSLFEFCVDSYNYSRSTAWRRVSAARCIAKYPRGGEMFLVGELNLCAISMLSGILTKDNAGEILAWAGGRPVRDIEMLVAAHKPERVTRDRIKPVLVMRPDPGADAGLVHASASSDHLKETRSAGSAGAGPGEQNSHSSFNIETVRSDTGAECAPHRASTPGAGHENSEVYEDNTRAKPQEQVERVQVTQKFKLEFAVDPAFMKKLEKIRSLLSTKHPRGMTLEALFGIIMDEYIDHHGVEKRIERRNKSKKNTACVKNDRKSGSRSRTRNIPQAVRDEVFARDGGRCTFVGPDGRRCNSKWGLEIDHIVPYARGGDNSPGNLRLLCSRHNILEAERVYGKEYMNTFKKHGGHSHQTRK